MYRCNKYTKTIKTSAPPPLLMRQTLPYKPSVMHILIHNYFFEFLWNISQVKKVHKMDFMIIFALKWIWETEAKDLCQCNLCMGKCLAAHTYKKENEKIKCIIKIFSTACNSHFTFLLFKQHETVTWVSKEKSC